MKANPEELKPSYFIKGCIILYIVRIFSFSELVEPHIIPLKVPVAVALKEEAK